jgi:hypothetical protein
MGFSLRHPAIEIKIIFHSDLASLPKIKKNLTIG